MFKQMGAVVQTYTERISFRIISVFTLVWLFSWLLLAPAGMLPEAYAVFAFSLLCIWGVSMGSHLSFQFGSSQSRLVPQFAAPHLAVAVGLCGTIAVLLAMVAAFESHGPAVTAEWKGVSRIGLSVFGWSLFLLGISIGCLYPLATALAFPSLVLIAIFTMTGSSIWLSIMSNGPAVVAVFLLNSILTIVLVRRMCRLHDGMRESAFYGRFEPMLYKRRIWSRQRVKGLNRTDYVLDSIRRPISSGFLSQARHFRLGLGVQVNVLTLIPVLVATVWVTLFIFPQGSRSSLIPHMVGTSSITTFAIFFAPMAANRRNRFQWIMVLPMRREEIVFRYGFALWAHILKVWFTIATVFYIVAWIPFPGVPHHPPSLLPFMDSLAAQVPIFGSGSLILARPRAVGAYLVAGIVYVGLIGASFLNEVGFSLLLPMMFLVLGVCLIALSYRRWLNLDLG